MTAPAPRALTFDCFGTLVDWRRGQRKVLASLPGAPAGRARLDAVERARMRAEQRLQAGPYRPYAEILAASLRAATAETLDAPLSHAACADFAQRMPEWPAFPEVPAALRRLEGVAAIGLLSNCDRAVLQRCAERTLGVAPRWMIPAEEVRSYKPAPGHWKALLERSGCAPEEVLHVSAYAHYDLRPAHALGIPVAFVARDGEQAPGDVPLRHQARDLAHLAELLGAPRAAAGAARRPSR